MQIKVFEVRDRATCISVMAIKMAPPIVRDTMDEKLVYRARVEEAHLRRAGYGFVYPSVMMARLDGRVITYAPHSWNDRTYLIAHKYIDNHFDELETGEVVDVEYILGETSTPKERKIL